MELLIKACIFDLDGTLLNTIEDICDSLNESLKKHGYSVHSVEDCKKFVGSGTKKLIYRAMGIIPSDEEYKKVFNDYLELYEQRLLNKTKPYKGIFNILTLLQEKNIPISVFSNKPQSLAERAVKYYFPDIDFSAIFGQNNDYPRKPDPTVALKISEIVNINPKEIAFIGDSVQDYKTARNAGMIPVSVLWGYQEKKDIESVGAHCFFDNTKELLEFLQNNI